MRAEEWEEEEREGRIRNNEGVGGERKSEGMKRKGGKKLERRR